MADDFLGKFLGNNTRARLLRVFTFNQGDVFTLSMVARRAALSPKVVQREIRSLEQIGILKKGKLSIEVGKTKKKLTAKQKEPAWAFDPEFKHASAISKFVHEVSPVHYKSIVGALRRSGRIAAVILSGTFMGDPSRPADLIVAADSLNEPRLESAIRGLEPSFGREIRYAAFTTPEFRYRLTIQDKLLRDTLDYPHIVLVDKTRLL